MSGNTVGVGGVVIVVLLATTAGGVVGDRTSAGVPNQAGAPDPSGDVVGWEGGYWYNESVDVDQSDGLSESELRRWTDLAMAHAEYIVGREFERNVTVQVLTPGQAGESLSMQALLELQRDERYAAWTEQLAEAQFLVGENETLYDVGNLTAEELLVGAYGYYDYENDELVLLRNETQSLAADNFTLHHELVHALQDQVYNLSQPKYNGETIDENTGVRGITEGQAAWAEHRYGALCADGTFDCVATPSDVLAPPEVAYDGLPPNITGVQPYSDGAAWVRQLYERGGQSAVEAVFENPPISTEQTLHIEKYPNETPAPLEFEDASRNGWETFEVDASAPSESDVEPLALGENGTERMGELELYTMFADHALESGSSVIDVGGYGVADDGPFDYYNYTSPPTAGWGNDRLVPYRNPTENDTAYGYVWVTTWDSERDAEQFHEAYLQLLREQGARLVGEDTFEIPTGPFADSFHVSVDDRRVTIVNGPTRSALADIRPGVNAAANETTA